MGWCYLVNFKICMSYDLTVLLLGVHLQKHHTLGQNTHSNMFIEVLLAIVKTNDQKLLSYIAVEYYTVLEWNII